MGLGQEAEAQAAALGSGRPATQEKERPGGDAARRHRLDPPRIAQQPRGVDARGNEGPDSGEALAFQEGGVEAEAAKDLPPRRDDPGSAGADLHKQQPVLGTVA